MDGKVASHGSSTLDCYQNHLAFPNRIRMDMHCSWMKDQQKMLSSCMGFQNLFFQHVSCTVVAWYHLKSPACHGAPVSKKSHTVCQCCKPQEGAHGGIRTIVTLEEGP